MANDPTRNALLTSIATPKETRSATFAQGAFVTGYSVSLSSSSSNYFCLTTGNIELVFSGFNIATNSGEATFELFENTDYTGGTSVPLYITNRNSTNTPDVTNVVTLSSVTAEGNQVAPTFVSRGDNANGRNQQVFQDIPFILKPNTAYSFKITHVASQTREFEVALSGFENTEPSVSVFESKVTT